MRNLLFALLILLVAAFTNATEDFWGIPAPTKGGYILAYDAEGNPMMWIKNGTTVECVGTDSERQEIYGIGECSPQ